MDDPIERKDAYTQTFCQEGINYVYRVCNEGAFDMKFKIDGQNPTRAALKYSSDDMADLDKKFDVLPKYDGFDSCPYVFKYALDPDECMEYPSTFFDVKGQLFGENESANKFLERKFNGCWSRDEFEFNLGFDLLDPFPIFPEEPEEPGTPPAPSPSVSLPSKSKGKGKGTTTEARNFFLRRRGKYDV